MPDTTVKLQDITPVKSTFDSDDQILLINPTGEARISKEDFLDAMPDDAITLIGDITTTGIEGDTVAKQLGALENSKAAAITDTATGTIANFPDGADDIPVTSLVANIEPKQSGSGDPAPDNIRPISGWTGCNVTRTGKNLKNLVFSQVNSSNILTNTFSLKAGTYTLSVNYSGTPTWGIYLRNGSIISSPVIKNAYNTTSLTFTLDRDYSELCASMYYGNGITVSEVTGIQLELGSSATAYEPYQGETVTVDWTTEAGTVYGGTIDVATGLLTVDRAMVDAGTLSWNYSGESTNHRFSANMPSDYKQPTSAADRANIICSRYAANPSVVATTTALGISGYQGGPTMFIRDLAFSDNPSFNAAMSGVQIVYKLATPQTYQLTPQEVKTLLGTNNVWADTGNVSVTYPADTKMFIEKLTMPTEDDLVANQAITSGKYFMIGNSLYLALANIASGAQITIGTNAQRVSLADALNTINS